MSERLKDIVVSILFIVIIIGVFIANLVLKDNDISISERRKLAKFPTINSSIFSKSLTDEVEEYAMDQFLLRDEFRSIKTFVKLDYKKLNDIMHENINSNIKYIDIYNELAANDYYNTDTHWKQQNIVKIANKISKKIGFSDRITEEFETKEYTDEFYGTYYGQLGKKINPDNIEYLTNSYIENAITYNYETNKEARIYDIQKADLSMDKYDLFLSGATPIIEIRNNDAKTDKELIIFRDSFGSSLAPLFTQAYSKIILVDIRYISTDLISNYISFNSNQDVLFLYSTLVINESGALK